MPVIEASRYARDCLLINGTMYSCNRLLDSKNMHRFARSVQ